MKSHIFALFMALFMLGLFSPLRVTLCLGAVPGDGRAGPFPLSIGRLLAQANDYYHHGDLESAERTWAQAKAQWPSLSEPPWKHRSFASPPSPARAPSKPEELRGILEERIRKYPGDAETRRALLKIAEESGDSQTILRHRSILEVAAVPEQSSLSFFLKSGACVLLLLLVAWQARKLFLEFSSR